MKSSKTIFHRSNFKLCDVPVPEGYPQSQTHVGVFPHAGRLILTSSPFPLKKYNFITNYARALIRKVTMGKLCPIIKGETFENPLLYISTVDDHTRFKLMQSKPLMEQPDPYYGYPSFNSDPDIYVEGDRVYILNRAIFRTRLSPGMHRDEYNIRIYLIEGLIDEDRFKLLGINLIREMQELSVSPCLVRYNGGYKYFEIFTNCYNDGKDFECIKYKTLDTIKSLPNQNTQWNNVRITESSYLPWHMSVFEYNNILYAVIACVKKNQPFRCYQMFGEFSSDLSTLTIYKTPLTDYNSYRGSAYVDKDNVFHLYTTTVWEKIKGSKSVDGREILTASMNFDELLKKIRQ